MEKTKSAETKMNRIYEQAKDLHVRNNVVYGNTDNKIYYDAAYTDQVTQPDLEDAFIKGALLIDDGTNKLVPVVLAGNIVKTIGESGSVSWEALIPEDAE